MAKEGIKYDCDQCEYKAKLSESSQAIKTEGNARRKPFFFSGKRPYTARVIQGPPGIFHEPGNFHGRPVATMHNLISESHPDNMNGITKNHILAENVDPLTQ